MSDRIIITKEMVMDARDYLENAVKEAWVSENATKCFDRLSITADGEPVPPMYIVNEGLKRRYLMAAFAALYMKQDYEAEEKDTSLMTEECFDRWAGGHAFEQLQRMKHDAVVRDKCYDIVADYRELERRFVAQITGLLAVQNDVVIRQNEYSAAQIKALPEIIEQLKNLQEAKTDGGVS